MSYPLPAITIGRSYSAGEELANALTHGVGALLSIAGLIVLVTYSVLVGDYWHITTTSVYGFTLITLYTASTLYHGIPHPRAKQVLQKLDHAAIFLLIAGTYTPFTLINLRDNWGWALFVLVWALAIAGIFFEFGCRKCNKAISISLYLGIGWVALIAIKPLLSAVEPGGLSLLIAGGVAYSLGVVFYSWKSLAYHHAVWHLFVLAGSAFHFFAVLFYVLPSAS